MIIVKTVFFDVVNWDRFRALTILGRVISMTAFHSGLINGEVATDAYRTADDRKFSMLRT